MAKTKWRPKQPTRQAGIMIDTIACCQWADNFSNPSEAMGRAILDIISLVKAGDYNRATAYPFTGRPILSSFRRRHIPNWIRRRVLSAGRCAQCNTRQRLSVDHIKPVSRGGGDELENLQCLCFDCNLRKHAKWVEPSRT